jgi:HSP20 family protein
MLTSTSHLDRMVALNTALDRMLDQATRSNTRFWVPAVDVAENPGAYLIAAELPGVRREDLDIAFEQNVLTIRGHKRPAWEQKEGEELRVYTAERAAGSFERAVRLPEFVDGDRIEARFEDGLLLITIPKSPSAQPRKIPIRTS